VPGRRHRAPCGAAAPVPWLTSQRDMQAPQGGLCGAGPVPQHPRTSAPPPPEPAAASHPFLRRWSQINYVPYVPGAHGSSLIQQHAELGDTASSACGCMRTLIRPCSCARSFGATNGGISPAATTSISGPVHSPPPPPPPPPAHPNRTGRCPGDPTHYPLGLRGRVAAAAGAVRGLRRPDHPAGLPGHQRTHLVRQCRPDELHLGEDWGCCRGGPVYATGHGPPAFDHGRMLVLHECWRRCQPIASCMNCWHVLMQH